MGQYFKVINLDKKQFLNPHEFDSGLKFLEFAGRGDNIMMGVAILCSAGTGGGGADMDSASPLLGSWAGDRVIIAGDYYDDRELLPEGAPADVNLYGLACGEFEDISSGVAALVAEAAEQ